VGAPLLIDHPLGRVGFRFERKNPFIRADFWVGRFAAPDVILASTNQVMVADARRPAGVPTVVRSGSDPVGRRVSRKPRGTSRWQSPPLYLAIMA